MCVVDSDNKEATMYFKLSNGRFQILVLSTDSNGALGQLRWMVTTMNMVLICEGGRQHGICHHESVSHVINVSVHTYHTNPAETSSYIAIVSTEYTTFYLLVLDFEEKDRMSILSL